MALQRVDNVKSIRVQNLNDIIVGHCEELPSITIPSRETLLGWKINGLTNLALEQVIDTETLTKASTQLQAHRVDGDAVHGFFAQGRAQLSILAFGVVSHLATTEVLEDPNVVVLPCSHNQVL